jgi:hypothetical protein
MLDIFITADSIVKVEDVAAYNVNTPEFTKQIMENVTDVISLIKSIEKFNEENNLPLEMRVPYQITTDQMTIDVAKSYFLGSGETTLCVVGWNSNGNLRRTYKDGKIDSIMNDVATYVIPVSHINTVGFGTYDPSKVTIFDKTNNEASKIDSKEFYNSLSRTFENMTMLNRADELRNMITLYHIDTIKNKYNELSNYTFSPKSMSLYQKINALYFSKLGELLDYFLKADLIEIAKGYTKEKSEYHKYRFYITEADMNADIKKFEEHKTDKFRDKVSNQNCFTLDEIAKVAEALGNPDAIAKTNDIINSLKA